MKFSDYIFPLIFVYIIIWGIQYYFGWGYTSNVPCSEKKEQHFVAPIDQVAHKPLQKEIDFFDQKDKIRPEVLHIDADWGSISFSTVGGIIESIDFFHEENHTCPIRTIFPVSFEQKEDRALLIALDEKTPLMYTLVSQKKVSDEKIEIVYQAKTASVIITKTFLVDLNMHKIDLDVHIVPDKHVVFEFARIIFPAPVMSETVSYNVVSSVVIDNAATFIKTSMTSLDMQKGWFAPQMFGSDNKYFAHIMVDSSQDAIARAYYKFSSNGQLIAIAELPTIDKETSFQFSFYFGPKKLDTLMKVDSRLESILDYSGIFSPIAIIMLKLLKWFYSYLHNFGLAIIALIILMQLLFLPLTMRGEKAMRQQQAMQARLSYLKQKYKNDPERLQLEQAELIKKQGIAGIGGCLLPMVIKAGMFFPLRTVLNSSFEMYKASFFWITDLSATDPYYILPLLVGLSMALQFMQMPDKKQRMNSMVFAVVLAGFSTTFSAGLALYLVISTLLAIGQTKLIKILSK